MEDRRVDEGGGRGGGGGGNGCPKIPRLWKTPLDILRPGSFVN